MTLHPLLLAIVVADAIAAVLVISVAITAVRVMIGWRPGAATRAQLVLERRVEAASLQGRGASWLILFASLLAVGAIAGALPPLVPGAMCGTGVMEATGGLGGRALVLRGLAVAALGAWHLLDRLDRSAPVGPLTSAAARAWLVATPLALLAAWDTFGALSALDVEAPVSCCAAVYEVVARQGAAAGTSGGPSLALFIAGAALLLLGGSALVTSRRLAGGRFVPWAVGLTSLAWAPLALLFVVDELAAYHYEVLHHHCPWCLFLGEHGGVGWPIFGALLLLSLEGPAAMIAAGVGRRSEPVAAAARARTRRAGLTLIIALVVLLAFAASPAVAWRLEHGVWMR